MSTSLFKPHDIGHDGLDRKSEAVTGSSWGLVILLLMFVAVALLWVAAVG